MPARRIAYYFRKVVPHGPGWVSRCRIMKVKVLLIALSGMALGLTATPASAWVETHLISDDVRVEVDRFGSATIDHGIVISAQTEKPGPTIPLQVMPRPDGALRVNVAGGRGLSRGIFLFHVRYRKNLLTGDNIRRDGAMLRVRWTGPIWQEGHDNARCTFVLPAAPTEPRASG